MKREKNDFNRHIELRHSLCHNLCDWPIFRRVTNCRLVLVDKLDQLNTVNTSYA